MIPGYSIRGWKKEERIGQKQVILDLDHVVPLDRAQPEVKALFIEHSQNVFWDKCLDVIDDLYPDIK